MTTGPPELSPQSPSALEAAGQDVPNLEADPLLEGGGAATSPPTTEQQRPRGHRQRRTTLPRATRGWSRSIVWSLIGLTIFSTLYGLFAKIDSSIEAPGKLKPKGGVITISPPFNSLVDRVLVREGQLVQAGQPLLVLRDQLARQQQRHLVAIRDSWRKEVNLLARQLGLPADRPGDRTARRQLRVSQEEVRLRIQAAREEAARNVINTKQQLSDLEGLQRKLAINRNITARLRTLMRQGGISKLEVDRQLERQAEIETALRRTQLEVASGRRREREGAYKTQQISAANSKQLFTYYDNARNQLRDSENRILENQERLHLSRLRAPAVGLVFDLNVKRGEIASPASPALKIVPQDALVAVLDVSNRDIGFVQVGMPVEVRVTSFPFTDYGSLKGKLVSLSVDAKPADATHAQEYFQATVRLNRNVLQRDGRPFDLRPGMAVTGLMQLGPRPVITLLGDRLTSFLDSTRSIR